jgi:hypothetical protein
MIAIALIQLLRSEKMLANTGVFSILKSPANVAPL